ncbi:unnamed protein product, partial [Ilex paraguariensis]
MNEVKATPTTKVEDLAEKIPTCGALEDEECFEDIQDAYDQLNVQFLKQQKKVFSFNDRVNSSKEDRKALHLDLVKPKTQICGLEEDKKSFLDRVSFFEREDYELV